MFYRPAFRLVPDGTRIKFMRGRYIGLATSAVLSVLSLVAAFYPGLNLGIDFRGGIVMEVRTPAAADFTKLRAALDAQGAPPAGLQRFGDDREVLMRSTGKPPRLAPSSWCRACATGLEQAQPGTVILRNEAVGASVSDELFQQRPAGAGHQPADDPGVHLVPVRVAVRRRRGGDAAAGRDQGHRLPGRHADRVRPGDGGGDPDRDRLFHQRQGGGVRPGAGEPAQIQDRCRCGS